MVQQQKELKIHASPDMARGAYANNLLVQHNKNEFILDFIMLVPPTGALASRVITSPAQAKRIANALAENVARYEKTFGPVEVENVPRPNVDIAVDTKQ